MPAAAAGKAAKKALSTSEAERQMLAEVAKDLPEMQDAAHAYAKRVAVRQMVMLKLFQPLARLVGVRREYFDNDFPREMAARIEDIPDDDVVSPSPVLAVPAMQALGYSLEEPDLKEMYLQLLATATDGRRTQDAHPAFADVIKQLSPAEAGVLLSVLRGGNLPLAEIRRVIGDAPGYQRHISHVTPLRWVTTNQRIRAEQTSAWIDNWVRLGLVTVSYMVTLTSDVVYEWVDGHPDVVDARANGAIASSDSPADAETVTYNAQRGSLVPTDFGERFLAAVTSHQAPDASSSMPVQQYTARTDWTASN